ncbi:MAG TPA: hypothetical protein VIT91_03790 [Chthoniobacterales bacterium]
MTRDRYRLFRRGRVFYAHDSQTGKQQSLNTRDRKEADRLLHAKNESHRQPLINLAMARSYLFAHDPRMKGADLADGHG